MPRITVLCAVLVAFSGALLSSGGCQGYREGSSRTVGEFTDDVAIQARVKVALLNDSEIKGLTINTEVSKGVVTLFGRVASHEQKQRAIELASSVKGVQRVDDRLSVVPRG